MTILKGFAAILIASTVMSGVAYAADSAANTQAPPAKQDKALNKAIDKDVGKLSKDGAQALRDIQATRLAIFNAQPDKAKSLINKAKEEMAKAAKDDSVFMKTAAELTPAKSAEPGEAKAADNAADTKTQIAWLPVDSQISLGENFQATPEKMAAVSAANDSLKKSDREGAIEKLALANVDVKFTTAVLPLKQTTADVDKAADLIDKGKFYEANAVLKDATDHAMLNVVDVYGQPYKAKAATAASDAKAPAKPAAADKTTETTPSN